MTQIQQAMSFPLGEAKEQLEEANKSNEQLKDIQENMGKILSIFTKTNKLLQLSRSDLSSFVMSLF